MAAPTHLGWLALVLCSGCTKPAVENWAGLMMGSFFPFDGARTWEFVNDDPEIAWHVIATLDSEPRVLEDGVTAAYTIEYELDCIRPEAGCVTGDPFRIRSLTLSSDRAFGTLLHDVDTVAEGLETFDPPMLLTGPIGSVGDVWEGESGDAVWTSILLAIGPCDIPYTDEWEDCVTLDVDGDPSHPLHGWWTAAPGYNVVAFQWRDDPEPWRLIGQSYMPPVLR